MHLAALVVAIIACAAIIALGIRFLSHQPQTR
jgi:hypothetical protein